MTETNNSYPGKSLRICENGVAVNGHCFKRNEMLAVRLCCLMCGAGFAPPFNHLERLGYALSAGSAPQTLGDKARTRGIAQ